ncbi:MAG TPA: hypothetical protein VFA84_14700 [Acidimicrobiales bacterium]|nr:hypothetical protein [Acidimicrobiales bacterium]
MGVAGVVARTGVDGGLVTGGPGAPAAGAVPAAASAAEVVGARGAEFTDVGFGLWLAAAAATTMTMTTSTTAATTRRRCRLVGPGPEDAALAAPGGGYQSPSGASHHPGDGGSVPVDLSAIAFTSPG